VVYVEELGTFPSASPCGRQARDGPPAANHVRPAGLRTGRWPDSARFELVINLKTAKATGIDIPATVLARANELIE
jgi:hypothetical protein